MPRARIRTRKASNNTWLGHARKDSQRVIRGCNVMFIKDLAGMRTRATAALFFSASLLGFCSYRESPVIWALVFVLIF
jgi:hypothetical protein